MAGKRKRANAPGMDPISPYVEMAKLEPISAVAAAKSRSQPVTTPKVDIAQEAQRTPAFEALDSYFEAPSSEEEDIFDILDNVVPRIVVPRNVLMCNWRGRGENVLVDTDNELTVLINNDEDFALMGVFDFVVLKGAININGANFAASQRPGQNPPIRRAFVSSTRQISIIKALDHTNQVRFLHCEDHPTPFAGVSPLFINIWNERPSGLPCRSFTLLPESMADLLYRALIPESIPQDWIRQIEDCACNLSITLVCGAPSSGKSTFARRLLNRYLTGHGKLGPSLPSVYFLDLDSNQPEYSPHGQVSLTLVRETNLGPPFTHPTTTPGVPRVNESIRSHPLPVTDHVNFQDYFISCVEDLVQTYTNLQQRNPSIPLIINTPGWIYTSSFDVLLQILSRTAPPRLVHLRDLDTIDEEMAHKFHDLNTTAAKNRVFVHEISAQSRPLRPCRTDAELRSMHMLSYFHHTGQVANSQIAQSTYDSRPLSYTTPWEFCYEETDSSQQAFIGFLMLSEWVEPQHLFTALNGSIIQIVETEDENVQDLFKRLPRTNKYHIPYFEKGPNDEVEPLDPRTSRLVCTALLRGWDPETRVAQVLVPKTHEVLMHGLKPEKTVFVFGCCDSPEWAYTEDAYYEAAELMRDGEVANQLVPESVELPPWVAWAKEVGGMGYLNTVRRIRKFQR